MKHLSIPMIVILGLANLAAAVPYDIIDLGTLGGETSNARAINSHGQVVGTSGSHVFLWDAINGMIDLGLIGDRVNDINDSGQIVGYFEASDGFDHAYCYDIVNGFRDLGTCGENSSAAYSINNSGEIVGNAFSSDPSFVNYAILWSSTGALTDLGNLGQVHSYAKSINDYGQVAGHSQTHDDKFHAFLWEETSGMTDLGALSEEGHSFVTHINNSGQVAGWSVDNEAHAFLWDSNRDMIDLGTLGGDNSFAASVNDYAQVVGYSVSDNGDAHAFLWDSANGMIDLNDLLPVSSDWQYLASALDINNQGQIVGYGYTNNGDKHAFVMTIPEPCTLFSLALGGLALYRRSKRSPDKK